MKRIPIPALVTAAALVLIFVIYMITFQVRFNEAAVKVRFGKADESSVIVDPGLYFKWPLVESTKKYDMRLRVVDTPDTEIKTRDGKALIVGAFAVWKIADPLKFYVRVPNEADAESELRKRLNEARSTVIGRHNMNEFFNLDRDQVDLNWDAIETQMRETVAPGVLSDYGVEIRHVGVRRVALPSEVTAKVQTSMQEEWKAQANTLREEGKGLAAAIRAQAEADRDKILAFARRRAQEIESQGVEASARIMQQISDEDSEFYIWLQYLDALKAAFEQRGTIFLDSKDVIYPFFADPLMPLRNKDAGQLAPAVGGPSSSPAE